MAQYDINLREYWRILRKRKFMVVSSAVLLGVFSTAFAILKAPTPIYTSTCSIEYQKESTVEGLYAKTLTWSSGDDLETQMSVIRSYQVFKAVAEKMNLVSSKTPLEDLSLNPELIRTIEQIQSKVTVEREKFTSVIYIHVTDTVPAFASSVGVFEVRK